MEQDAKAHGRTVTILAFLTWGLSMLCRTAFGYYVEPLELTATQAGIANFLTSFCICISAVVVSRIAERDGKQRQYLTGMLLICVTSVAMIGVCRNFPMVLLSKALLGIGCGPLFTFLMTMTERASTPEQYPTNAGIVANGEAILATIAGPVLIVSLMSHMGFLGTNLILAALLAVLTVAWFLVGRGSSQGKREKAAPAIPIRQVLCNRNILLCIVGGVGSLLACWCIYVYAPSMLLEAQCYSDSTMSLIMTMMGLFMATWMLFLPYLSNKYGRKPVIVVFSLLGAAALLALAFRPAKLMFVLLFILFGGCCSVISMFFMAIIPVDSVPAGESATAVALINAASELLGASLGPLVAGVIADYAGMRYGMLLAALAMVITALAAALLRKPDPA